MQEVCLVIKVEHSLQHLPVLEEDGRFLEESTAIARYLARKYGLSGQDAQEQAKVDELTDYQMDIYERLKPYYLSILGIEKADEVTQQNITTHERFYNLQKDRLYSEVFKPVFPEYLRRIGKNLYTNSTGYLVGNKETFIDFWVAE